MDDPPPTDRLPDNAARALLGLRRLVAEGVEGSGRLPAERELSERFAVSRRAVRRALEVLEAEGLVWRQRGKGTFAGQPPEPATGLVAELTPEAAMEARLALEPAIAALCARRAGSHDVTRLRAVACRAAASEGADEAELWDGAFHRLVARIAGNPLLLAAFAALDEVRAREDWRRRRARARSPEALSESLAQHDAIVEAVARGDEAGARDAMAAHLERLARLLEASG